MDIKLQEVCKSYENTSILNKITLSFKENEVTFLQGTSGIGKTTLIRLLMRLERVDSGTISGLEHKIISAVFQDNLLCESVSVEQNLLLVNPKLSLSTMLDSLESMHLHGCLKKKVSTLSGGMKRRVAILRALLYPFDLLIMDEPFKGLDSTTKQQVMDFVISKIKDKTVIIVTHDTSEYEYFIAHTPDQVNLVSLSQ